MAVSQRFEWQALTGHHTRSRVILFAADPARVEQMVIEGCRAGVSTTPNSGTHRATRHARWPRRGLRPRRPVAMRCSAATVSTPQNRARSRTHCLAAAARDATLVVDGQDVVADARCAGSMTAFSQPFAPEADRHTGKAYSQCGHIGSAIRFLARSAIPRGPQAP